MYRPTRGATNVCVSELECEHLSFCHVLCVPLLLGSTITVSSLCILAVPRLGQINEGMWILMLRLAGCWKVSILRRESVCLDHPV